MLLPDTLFDIRKQLQNVGRSPESLNLSMLKLFLLEVVSLVVCFHKPTKMSKVGGNIRIKVGRTRFVELCEQ